MQFITAQEMRNQRGDLCRRRSAQGLSDEGGLFVPASFPQVDLYQALCAQPDYPGDGSGHSWGNT